MLPGAKMLCSREILARLKSIKTFVLQQDIYKKTKHEKLNSINGWQSSHCGWFYVPGFLNEGLTDHTSLVKVQYQDFSQCVWSRKIATVLPVAGLSTQG